MATPEVKAKAVRVKLVTFPVPDAAAVNSIVDSGKATRTELPARDAKVGKNGKMRKGRPASTRILSDNRAGALALFGGVEKAVYVCATLFRSAYITRMTSKTREKNIFRAVNRTAEVFDGFTPEMLAKMSPAAQAAIATLRKEASANPVPPRKRNVKAKA